MKGQDMTDQSDTPATPPRKSGPSLIERAAGTFDFRQHMRAPVLPPVSAKPVPDRPVPDRPVSGPEPIAAPEQPEQPEQPAIAPEAPEPASFAPEGAQVFIPAPADAATPATPAGTPLDGIPSRQRFRKAVQPIDRRLLREQCLIEPEGPVSALLEEFRIVKRQLLLTAADSRAGRTGRHGERILVCSAHPGEGKTFCAVNLALSIAAEKDNDVLLVDADFAKPSVLSTLGLPGGPGLMDALADPEVMVEECIIPTDIPGLSVLPAGNQTGSDTEYLASVRTRAILDTLTAQAPSRIVIFDSPPALAASPASELAMHVGQALMVVRADVTGEAALRDAVGILSGCADIKLLLNGTRFSPTGRRFGTYYGYKE